MRKRGVFGLVAAGLAALITAAPADSQTAKKTSGKGIALEICRTETFADAFDIFLVRRSGTEKASMEHPSDAQETASCLRIMDRMEELKDAEIDEDRFFPQSLGSTFRISFSAAAFCAISVAPGTIRVMMMYTGPLKVLSCVMP